MIWGKSIFPAFAVTAPMPSVKAPVAYTPEQVTALASAMWQLLDDMQTDGQCACRLAIAEARIAYEPFAPNDPGNGIMQLETAKAIVADVAKYR